jgi:uncharacterized protein GlcG (DUF336 family)
MTSAADLPTKKTLNLAAIKTMVAGFPKRSPNQGGLPIQVHGQTIGGIAASGAASEIDEAIAQAAIDALRRVLGAGC